jgi:hypothetical protein
METSALGTIVIWQIECFVLAAVTKDPNAVAELLKTGDDYLRRAAEWRTHQSRSDPK